MNGQSVKSNYKVKPGDEVAIVMAEPPREYELIPEEIPLDICTATSTLLSSTSNPGYLSSRTWKLLGNLSARPGLPRGKFTHRQQRRGASRSGPPPRQEYFRGDGGGCFGHAMSHLAKQFFDTTRREYVAIVWGNVREDEGTITGHIGRSLRDIQMAVFEDGLKQACGDPLQGLSFGYITVVSCRLETGRTHQIRVHEVLGHPLFNDELRQR